MNEVFNKYCIYLKYLLQVACAEKGEDFDSTFKSLSTPQAKAKQNVEQPKPAPQPKPEPRPQPKTEPKPQPQLTPKSVKTETEPRPRPQPRPQEKHEEPAVAEINNENMLTNNCSAADKDELADYVNALVLDLAAGKKRTYRSKIFELAKNAGMNGKEFVDDFERFMLYFKKSIEDGVINKREYYGLQLEGKSVLVRSETIEKIIEPYN